MIFLLSLLLMANGSHDRTTQALEALREAQQYHINDRIPEMMNSLHRALELRGDDKIIAEHAYGFAKKYYALKEPPSIFEWPDDIKGAWVGINKSKDNNGPVEYQLHMTARHRDAQKVERIEILTADGRLISLYGDNTESSIYPSEEKPLFVLRAWSAKFRKPLTTGLYWLRLYRKGEIMRKFPLIIAVDASENSFPETAFDTKTKSVKWTAQPTIAYVDGMDRIVYLTLNLAGASRPSWSKDFNHVSSQPSSATSPFSVVSGEYVRKSIEWEVTHSTQLKLIYEHKSENTLKIQ